MTSKRRRNRRSVLIISNKEDLHANVVQKKLKDLDEEVFRFNTEEFAAGNITLTLAGTGKNFLTKGKSIVHLSDIKSAWIRRPEKLELALKSKAQARFGSRELTELWTHLYYALPRALWVSEHDLLERAQFKYVQLETAANVGLIIPKTCVTNSSREAKKFISSVSGEVIYKTLKQPYVEMGLRRIEYIPTTVLKDSHQKKIRLIRNSGGIFQEYINKAYELRITVVGNKVFAAKLDSQSHAVVSARVDWRNAVSVGQIPTTAYELPSEIAQRCKKLMRRLGVVFGAIDMARTTDGRYVFFEINPAGQWLWIEHETKQKISEAVARLLARIDETK